MGLLGMVGGAAWNTLGLLGIVGGAAWNNASATATATGGKLE